MQVFPMWEVDSIIFVFIIPTIGILRQLQSNRSNNFVVSNTLAIKNSLEER